MVSVTNTGQSPRGVHDKKGRHVLILPGQTKLVDLNSAGLKAIERKPVFKVCSEISSVVDAEISRVKASVDRALVSDAEGLGINVDRRWSDKRLQREIDKVLSDAVLDTDSDGV